VSGADPRRGYARSRERDAAIRAQLKPLGPNERPLGIKLAVALALVVAVANVAVVAAGGGGESPAAGIAFVILMLALAAGVWARKYIALLAFQALLALSMIVATVSLAFVGNIGGLLLCLGVLAACAPVFWLLIRVMARLQVPRE
jgi:hypothetical protein